MPDSNSPTAPGAPAAAKTGDETIAPAGTAEPKRPEGADEWRKAAGRIISILIILAACVLVLCVWRIIELHPRTDDAIAAANVIGVAPRVSGPIIKLNVQDNQQVNAGDVLFEIDPADYQLQLDNAQAALASLDRQIEVAHSQDENLRYQVKAAEAGVAQAQAQETQAEDTRKRIQPLLSKGFATADDVERAETAVKIARASLATYEQQLNQAKTTLSTLSTLRAQRPGAIAAVNLAQLNLSYCKIVAPFPGKVINLNLSVGAYVSVGTPVFSLLDLRHWYVIANFREGELRRFTNGSPVDVYLMSAPRRHFAGTVQGIGWAVQSADEININSGVPSVPRELNWVHIAQRFPVRIEVENADPDLFRIGESAVAIIK
ncbi:MAG TPA: HlyD family efflux transporter periplasmic adaptor subunit [Verrucomicrobiae bacterium]|jgi:multidrug efflux system membrane fusion protein|nr:HlyD family efflux transporter periplasmic adaptor subunit [Verrucomicrobiae bacterium]